LPGAKLDAFVDALAVRIASLDKQAIADTKHLVDIASPPSDAEVAPEWDAFLGSRCTPRQPNEYKSVDGTWLP
jgi:hypothetical protein